MKPVDYPIWFKIFVVVTVMLFGLNVAYFAAPIHALLKHATQYISGDRIVIAVGTVAASFAGASFAFAFAWYQTRRERITTEVAAGNRALFTLSCMWNVIKQRQKDFIEPARSKSDAWLNFHLGPPLIDNYSFDMKGLSFLLETAGSTFQRLFLEEERYRLLVHLVAEHRKLLLEGAWPRMEAAGVSLKDSRLESEMEKIIGVNIVVQLKSTVSAIITNFDEDEKSVKEAFIRLQEALKRIYPNRAFMKFTF